MSVEQDIQYIQSVLREPRVKIARIARMAGVSEWTVSQLRHGRESRPRSSTIIAVRDACHKEHQRILGMDEEEYRQLQERLKRGRELRRQSEGAAT